MEALADLRDSFTLGLKGVEKEDAGNEACEIEEEGVEEVGAGRQWACGCVCVFVRAGTAGDDVVVEGMVMYCRQGDCGDGIE